jgi:hypothetical protein
MADDQGGDMSTETSPENRSNVSYSSPRSHGRSIAILFALAVSLTVLGGIGVRRQYASRLFPQGERQSPYGSNSFRLRLHRIPDLAGRSEDRRGISNE